MKRLVSVIIPFYKAKQYLGHTLESVLAQTYPNFEVLLVNDCSPDETAEIATAYAKKDRRIRVLNHTQNAGAPAFGRNTALAVAKGEYVAFLDHDDLWEKEKLSVQIEEIEKQKVDFLCSNANLLNDTTNKVDGAAWEKVAGSVRAGFAKRLLQGNFIPPASTLIRTSVFATVGTFDTTLKGADDYDMWYRIVRVFSAGIVNKPLATWRYHNAESISADDRLMIEDEIRFYKKIQSGKPAFTGEHVMAKWQDWEEAIAQEGIARNQSLLGNRDLLAGNYRDAHAHYQAAGAGKRALATRLLPGLLRAGYHYKRSRQSAQAVFRPLDLVFHE